jgi:hypothetical protein
VRLFNTFRFQTWQTLHLISESTAWMPARKHFDAGIFKYDLAIFFFAHVLMSQRNILVGVVFDLSITDTTFECFLMKLKLFTRLTNVVRFSIARYTEIDLTFATNTEFRHMQCRFRSHCIAFFVFHAIIDISLNNDDHP